MNFIIYDVEATCWRGRPPKGINEVIEIGAIKLNAYGEVVSSFSKFIKPSVNPILSEFCRKLTHITQEDIDKAKGFPSVIEDFKQWIGVYEEDYVLGAWGDFDKRIIRDNCIMHKLEKDWVEYYINIKSQYNTLKRRVGKDQTGLKSTVKKEGFEFDGIHHRAISDAENLAKIFSKYIDEWIVVW